MMEFIKDCLHPIRLEQMRPEGYFRRRAAVKALYIFNRIERTER